MVDRLLQKLVNQMSGKSFTVDGPTSDTIDLSKLAFPTESYHNLDVLVTRDHLLEKARKGEDITVCAADAAGAYMSVLAEAMKNGAKVTIAMETGPRPVEVAEGEEERFERQGVPDHKVVKFNTAFAQLQELAEEGHGTLRVVDTWSKDPERPHLSALSQADRKASFVDFPHLEPEGRKRAMAKWLEGGEPRPRENHKALEDVTLGASVFARLIHEMGAKTVADIMPKDELHFNAGDTLEVFARAGSRSSSFSLESHNKGKLRLHKKTGQTVTNLEVLAVEKNRLKVRITTGSGKREEVTEGYVDPNKVRFKVAGEMFYRLREAGVALALPTKARDGEIYDPNGPAKRSA
ncbi:MAG: hypothetical protein AAFQ82_27565, partial [Myxococcota bacterium]